MLVIVGVLLSRSDVLISNDTVVRVVVGGAVREKPAISYPSPWSCGSTK
jgi:hypothetical protein